MMPTAPGKKMRFLVAVTILPFAAGGVSGAVAPHLPSLLAKVGRTAAVNTEKSERKVPSFHLMPAGRELG